ncbi:HAD-IIIA family hydrolase [bacterium]|nr:MAG: HAD-IIIA family hydrolase [bacterium]
MEKSSLFADAMILMLDVDGVLTDGRITLDGKGGETKIFDVRDGHGLAMLQKAGIPVAIITGRTSDAVAQRARELGISELHQGVKEKVPVVREILAKFGLGAKQAVYVGDDLVDLPVLLQVGVAVTVPEAPFEVKANADYVTGRRGGRGAVREVCEEILKARGLWEKALEKYLNPEAL